MPRGRPWHSGELAYLRENYRKPNGSVLCAEHLGRSLHSVHKQARRLNLTEKYGALFVRDRTATRLWKLGYTDGELAEAMGVRKGAVRYWRRLVWAEGESQGQQYEACDAGNHCRHGRGRVGSRRDCREDGTDEECRVRSDTAHEGRGMLTDGQRDLVVGHMRLARHIVRRSFGETPWMRDDLDGEAFLALAESAGRFDLVHGVTFVSFAARRIRGAILDYLRRCRPLGYRRRSQVRSTGRRRYRRIRKWSCCPRIASPTKRRRNGKTT